MTLEDARNLRGVADSHFDRKDLAAHDTVMWILALAVLRFIASGKCSPRLAMRLAKEATE